MLLIHVSIPLTVGTVTDTGDSVESGGEGAERALVLYNREAGPWWHRRHVGHRRGLPHPVCRLVLPPATAGWLGPHMRISLPSFRWVPPL